MSDLSSLSKTCSFLTQRIQHDAKALQEKPGDQEITERIKDLFGNLIKVVPGFENKKRVYDLKNTWEKVETLFATKSYNLRPNKRRKIDDEQKIEKHEAFLKDLGAVDSALKENLPKESYQTIADLGHFYEQEEAPIFDFFSLFDLIAMLEGTERDGRVQPISFMENFSRQFPVFKSLAQEVIRQIADFEYGEELATELEDSHQNLYNKQGMLKIILLYGLFFKKDKIDQVANEFGVEHLVDSKKENIWKKLLKEAEKRKPSLEKENLFSSPLLEEEAFLTSLTQVIAKMDFKKLGDDRAAFTTLCAKFFSRCSQEKTPADLEKLWIEADSKERKISILVEMLQITSMQNRAVELLATLESSEKETVDQFAKLFLEKKQYPKLFTLYEKLQDQVCKYELLGKLLCVPQVFERHKTDILTVLAQTEFDLVKFKEVVTEARFISIYKQAVAARMIEVTGLFERFVPESEKVAPPALEPTIHIPFMYPRNSIVLDFSSGPLDNRFTQIDFRQEVGPYEVPAFLARRIQSRAFALLMLAEHHAASQQDIRENRAGMTGGADQLFVFSLNPDY